MAGNISLVRVDFRLMHGQVIANWLNQVDANSIMIVDGKLSKDSFMQNIYKMAAPKGVKVSIFDLTKALEKIKSEKYMASRRLIVLFKSVEDAGKAKQAGFPMEELQIGGLGSGSNKIQITNQIYLDKQEMQTLIDLEKEGVSVFLQTVPKEARVSLAKAKEKVFAGGQNG